MSTSILSPLNPTVSGGNVSLEKSIAAQVSLAPKEPLNKGFVPVIPKLLHHYTNGWYKGYQWQVGHPIRQRALDKFECNRFLAYLIARLNGTVCTVSAYNVFSIFFEHSRVSQSDDFVKGMLTKYQKKGLENFKTLINEILHSKEQKGMACLCSIGNYTIYQNESLF